MYFINIILHFYVNKHQFYNKSICICISMRLFKGLIFNKNADIEMIFACEKFTDKKIPILFVSNDKN